MNDIILNIGLAGAAPGITLPVFVVCRSLRYKGYHQTTGRIVQSDTEATYVTQGYGLSDHDIHQLAIELGQDCIAVYDLMHREGRLIGPDAAKWGEFDPAQFFLPSGMRMGEIA